MGRRVTWTTEEIIAFIREKRAENVSYDRLTGLIADQFSIVVGKGAVLNVCRNLGIAAPRSMAERQPREIARGCLLPFTCYWPRECVARSNPHCHDHVALLKQLER